MSSKKPKLPVRPSMVTIERNRSNGRHCYMSVKKSHRERAGIRTLINFGDLEDEDFKKLKIFFDSFSERKKRKVHPMRLLNEIVLNSSPLREIQLKIVQSLQKDINDDDTEFKRTMNLLRTIVRK